jgi:16S rRNA (cytosine967-C5)-methyltransferase
VPQRSRSTAGKSARKDGSRQKAKPGLAARQYAVEALRAVVKTGTTLEQALADTWADDLPDADKALVRAIAATSLRRKGQIDALIRQLLAKPLPAKSGLAQDILWTGAAQILFMRVPSHAAIDLAVTMAKRDRIARHFAGLINAVLRRISREGEAIIAAQDAACLNIPHWMFDSWTKTYGADAAREIAAASLSEAPLDITPKADPATCAEALGGQLLESGTIRLETFSGRIEALPGYRDGQWWVQDAAAALPVKLLGSLTGKRVLDMCAAPGGKTAQLAAAGAEVFAIDISAERLERLRRNLYRLQLDATVICADATSWRDANRFDAIIADVPCSATGTLRRHPESLVTKQADLPGKLASVQRAIVRNAIALARPGGEIIICSCSLERQEAEGLVEDILGSDLPVARKPIRPDQLFGWQHMIDTNGDMRVLPFHSVGSDAHGLDGFFASRLARL